MKFSIGDTVYVKAEHLVEEVIGTITSINENDTYPYVVQVKGEGSVLFVPCREDELEPYRTKEPSVYCVADVPPEQLAYAMSAYSRSSKSFMERLKYIDDNNTKDFLEKFYLNYGHASIADMAHIPMMIENVSILAAIEIVDEQLWDGQERSTRYQNFTDAPYYIPQSLGDKERREYCAHMDSLFDKYHKTFDDTIAQLTEQYPTVPEGMTRRAYNAALRARAFDVARYYLPLGTLTSLGQVTSARTLEKQIARLRASRHQEVRDIADKMQQAAISDSLTPKGKSNPLAPTLIKYATPSPYRDNVAERIIGFIEVFNNGRIEDYTHGISVNLVEVDNPIIEALAKIVYAHTHLSFRKCVSIIQELSFNRNAINGFINEIFVNRGAFDDVLSEFKGGRLNFDVVMDIGGYRDLHRHRRMSQIRQEYTHKHGFITYEHLLGDFADKIEPVGIFPYTLPLGTLCRSLFSMDIAQLIYMVELRTKPSGHWSYRLITHLMLDEFVNKYPEIGRHIRVTDLADNDIFKR